MSQGDARVALLAMQHIRSIIREHRGFRPSSARRDPPLQGWPAVDPREGFLGDHGLEGKR